MTEKRQNEQNKNKKNVIGQTENETRQTEDDQDRQKDKIGKKINAKTTPNTQMAIRKNQNKKR